MLKSRASKSTMQFSVRTSTRPSVPANIQAAAQLIYFAIQDPSCYEIRSALDSMNILNHQTKSLDLDRFHFALVHAMPVGSVVKQNTKITFGGAMTLDRCILLGLFVVLLTVATYIISVRSEVSMYQTKCADVMALFDPKRGSVSTFFNEFNKFAQMVFNKEHIDYCTSMKDKYGSMGIYLARELNKMMGSLKARISISFAIVSAIAGILNGGVKALICIASKWMGEFDSVCGEACKLGEKGKDDKQKDDKDKKKKDTKKTNDTGSADKAKKSKKKKDEPEEEESEEEEEESEEEED